MSLFWSEEQPVNNEFIPATAEESAAVASISSKLKELPDLNHTFSNTDILRFFRSRCKDEDKTMKSIIRHAQWRRENNVDNIADMKETFQDELNTNKLIIGESDIKERPVLYIIAGKFVITTFCFVVSHATTRSFCEGRHDTEKRNIEASKKLAILKFEEIMKLTNPEVRCPPRAFLKCLFSLYAYFHKP